MSQLIKRMMQWNDTVVPFPDVCLHHLFEQQAEQHPDQVAAICSTNQLTFRELNERANQLAHYLQKFGVGPDVPVAVMLNRSVDMVVAILAILKSGGAYVPLDIDAPALRIQQILQEAQDPLCIAHAHILDRFPETEGRFVVMEEIAGELQSYPTYNLETEVAPEHMVSIYYTSGSTGRPKGVANTHRGWVNKMVSIQRIFGLQPGETILQKATLTFDDSAVELFWPLVAGGRVALIEPGLHRDPEAILDALAYYESRVLMIVPSMLNRLLDSMDDKRRSQMSKLRCTMAGGESLNGDMVKRFYERMPGRLYNTWGATEVSVDSTIYSCSEADFEEEGAVCIGKPFDNNRVYVLDEHLHPVETGVQGDLYIAGIGVSRGYINDPERTEKAFMNDPFIPGERMYKTFDRGYFREDGSIKFLGRSDLTVKVRGIRVEIGEIEARILKYEKIKEAVVLLREDVPGIKRLVAYVVVHDQKEVQKNELRTYLAAHLPLYMVPQTILFIDQMPLNQNDKVDRKALPAPDSYSRDLETDYVQPRSSMEAHLCGIFADVLGLECTGVFDDFFELGGDSITATQVMTRLRSTVDSKLALKVLFELKNVANIASYFEERGYLIKDQDIENKIIKQISRDQDLPLSYAQERLWFIQQMEVDSPAYNEPIAYRIQGNLHVEVLEKALREIVKRHESLRTYFEVVHSQPVQRVSPEVNTNLPVVDLSELPMEERETVLQMKMTEESNLPIDLNRSSLMKPLLFRLAMNEHILFVNMHHIITDAWSGVVFVEELGILYDVMLKKKENVLDVLPFQYADYAVWQREWMEQSVWAEQIPFWKQELAGELPVLQLPTDFPRQPIQTYAGDRLYFSLNAELAAKIEQVSKQNEASVYMVLLAAYNILLHRYSRQSHILVGSPIANRTMPGLERMIGFFVNTIVIRSEYFGEWSFEAYLKQIKERCLNVYNNQDVPFDQLVRELQIERNLAFSPLAQVMFAFQNKLEERLSLTDLQVDKIDVNTKTSRFDVTLFLTETQSGEIAGIYEYNTDLFKRETIERLLENFITILNGIVSVPARKIGELPLVSEHEKICLHQWNDTQVEFPRERVLQDLIEEQVQKTPYLTAAVFRDQEISYIELEKRSNQLAHYLIKNGVGPDCVVGICVQRSLDLVVALYAVLKAGGAFMPLDPEAPMIRLEQIIADANAPVCLTQQALRERLPHEGVTVISLDTEWDEIEQESSVKPSVQVTPDHIVSVYYTSGSTGKPKGVVNLHVGWVNRMCWMQNHFQLQPGESVLQKTTLTFDDSAVEFFWPLTVGGRIALIEPGAHLDPRAMIDAAIHYEAVHIQFVPSMLNLILDEITQEDRARLHKLRSTISSGEALSATTVERFFEKLPGSLNNTWGATEVSIDSTIHVCTVEDTREDGAVCVGKPIDNNRCYVLDTNLQPVPIGVIGELYLAGIGLAKGYANDRERTVAAFVDDPFERGERMYKTGDLGYRLPNGSIKFIGRVDNQVKIRGMRVELGEIEAVLFKHENVKEVVVLVQEDVPGVKRLIAYVVALDLKRELSSEELRKLLKDTLPDYMVPSFVMIIETMPLNANGKVDRKQLPLPDRLEHYTEVKFYEPEGPLEESLVEMWKEILKLENVGAGDNFFDLGGHSLLAFQVISRIREQFTIQLPVRSLFERPILRDLAAEIEQRVMELVESLTEEEAYDMLLNK
ncbi:amino acid adenylation domain-containing protein [Paenibacillus sp. SC116]|uniref:non-ribosomal peptide synthetase n=1 Tax=Paenibacillus sp. SC116 TaxID=2968986 RepID=UPI00215A7910|nr:non-ribosomal peptide synthetase [Paenibacillus sp. SC116]MCR8844948.1 amino acid adenylation domain-containing protein [Paenibacillus sp. SC116]